MPLSKIQSLSEVSAGRRNLIINGAFQIFQRATAATAATTSYNTADRFKADTSSDGAFTTEKSTDNPFGTGSSLKAQVTTADTSLASTQYARILQNIEAQNLQHLLYGTSSAKTLILSFWVKSSKTGIYSITLRKVDNTPYHFTHEYTISSANTWEKKIITITPTAGSTSFITSSAGAIANDNGLGLELSFALGQGSSYAIGTSNTWSSNTSTYASSNQVNWLDNTSNNFYLTQVQLEIGTTASEFEHRSFAEELTLCQRYFQAVVPKGVNIGYVAPAWNYSSSIMVAILDHKVEMRAAPTLETNDATNDFRFYRAGGGDDFDDLLLSAPSSTKSTAVYNSTDISGTQGHAGGLYINDTTNAFVHLKAEL